MSDGINRWAQVVRGPGEVQLHGSHTVDVPPEGGAAQGVEARPGVRLLTQPIGATPPYYNIDVTSTAVIAMLEPFLRSGVGIGRVLAWYTRGFGVRRRDTLHLKPRG